MLRYYLAVLILALILGVVIYNIPSSFTGGALGLLGLGSQYSGATGRVPVQAVMVPARKASRSNRSVIVTASEVNLAISNRLESREVIAQGRGASLSRMKLISLDEYRGSKWVLSKDLKPEILDVEYYRYDNLTKIIIDGKILEHIITDQHTLLIVDINVLPRLGEFIVLPMPPLLTVNGDKERFILYSVPIYEDNTRAQVILDSDLRYLALKPTKYKRYLELILFQQSIDSQWYAQIFEYLKVSDIAKYSQMNETTKRVKALAQQLYLSYRKRSLKELLSILTSVLHSVIEYSTELSIPRNVDVVDWVLFEGHRGVCVHYASAAAVLLRAMGIKARLAIGYLANWLTPYTYRSQPLSSSERVVVLSSHAWVEIYIPGFGWIPYDPTPTTNEFVDVFSLLSMGSVQISTPPTSRRPPGRLLQEELLGYQVGNETTQREIEMFRYSVLGCMLIAIIPLYMLSDILSGISNRFKYLLALLRKDYVKAFKLLLISLAKKYDIELRPSKTPREVTEAIARFTSLSLSEELKTLTDIYEKLRYSARKRSHEILREFWARYRKVTKMVKSREWY